MIEAINQYTIANEVRQRLRSRADVFVISETSQYDDFISQLFMKSKRNIIVAHKQQNVIGALEILQNDGYQNIYACLKSSIDMNTHSNLLNRILVASNWSNQTAKQNIEEIQKGKRPVDCDTENSITTKSNNTVPSGPEVNLGSPSGTEQSGPSLQSANDIMVAFESALSMGNSEQAIKLAKLGAELFPDNARLKRIAKILAPPVIRASQRPRKPSLEASRDWLRTNAQQYTGQWVAVCEGILIANAPTMQALLAEIDSSIDRDNTLITKVL